MLLHAKWHVHPGDPTWLAEQGSQPADDVDEHVTHKWSRTTLGQGTQTDRAPEGASGCVGRGKGSNVPRTTPWCPAASRTLAFWLSHKAITSR